MISFKCAVFDHWCWHYLIAVQLTVWQRFLKVIRLVLHVCWNIGCYINIVHHVIRLFFISNKLTCSVDCNEWVPVSLCVLNITTKILCFILAGKQHSEQLHASQHADSYLQT